MQISVQASVFQEYALVHMFVDDRVDVRYMTLCPPVAFAGPMSVVLRLQLLASTSGIC